MQIFRTMEQPEDGDHRKLAQYQSLPQTSQKEMDRVYAETFNARQSMGVRIASGFAFEAVKSALKEGFADKVKSAVEKTKETIVPGYKSKKLMKRVMGEAEAPAFEADQKHASYKAGVRFGGKLNNASVIDPKGVIHSASAKHLRDKHPHSDLATKLSAQRNFKAGAHATLNGLSEGEAEDFQAGNDQMVGSNDKLVGMTETETAHHDRISAGDTVSIRVPGGMGRNGVEYQVVRGKAVMRGPNGWVLNGGGKHGKPYVATSHNIVGVLKAKKKAPDGAGGALVRSILHKEDEDKDIQLKNSKEMEPTAGQSMGEAETVPFEKRDPSKDLFHRLSTKAEDNSPKQKSRAFKSMPDKAGHEKVYKPYGAQGRGFYYSPHAQKESVDPLIAAAKGYITKQITQRGGRLIESTLADETK